MNRIYPLGNVLSCFQVSFVDANKFWLSTFVFYHLFSCTLWFSAIQYLPSVSSALGLMRALGEPPVNAFQWSQQSDQDWNRLASTLTGEKSHLWKGKPRLWSWRSHSMSPTNETSLEMGGRKCSKGTERGREGGTGWFKDLGLFSCWQTRLLPTPNSAETKAACSLS